MVPKMALEMTAKDKQILQYICEKFSCYICNSILIQCFTLSCGHHYCNYCLDVLQSGMLNQCPECSSTILKALPNNSIDQQIDNLINSCSEPIRHAYSAALNFRFQKSMERKQPRHNERPYSSRCDHSEPKFSECLNEIRKILHTNDTNPLHSLTRSLKSARNHQQNQIRSEFRSVTSTPRSKPLTIGHPKTPESDTGIDMNKVNQLFGIYDHVLNLDGDKEMGAGDYQRENDLHNITFNDQRNNFTKRSEAELDTLIKETDDIIRLDGHIQKWTTKMKDALSGKNDSSGIADERFDKNIHSVNDELWTASNELLLKLQGIQQQRKKSGTLSFSCPPTPLPRSHKLNVDAVSDDSDAEEYQKALETLQESLEKSYDIARQEQAQQDLTGVDQNADVDTSREKSQLQGKQVGGSCGNRSARKKSILDCVEESGHNYIKENIDFITKMRKYKEALIKIQNREVATAQEIKELVPTRSFPSDGLDGSLNYRDATTPRRLPHISHGSRRNHAPYSARLPSTTTLDSRPMTATATYDVPAIHKQIGVVPKKQYLKPRTRTNGSLFTAR